VEWSKKPHIKHTWPFEEYGSSARDYILKKIKGDGYDYPFFILIEEKPIGYIQYCDLFAYRNVCKDLKGVLQNEPEGTYCIDLFIGDENFLGQGYGTQIMQEFCNMLFSKPEVKRIVIDPWVENDNAIRCYEKIGFKYLREGFDGVRQVQVMEKLRNEIIIETERLLLRQISKEDLEPLSKLFADPEVMKSSLEGPFPYEKTKKVLQNMISQGEKYGFSTCVVINKETKTWMGFVGLYWEEENGELKTDFAYRFFPQFWKQGYAIESVKACLQYISKHFPDIEINAYIESTNQASIQVAEKAGMVFVEETLYHSLPVRRYVFVGKNCE
jgi:[ribosomal protein S5]-alanine N-acetyltransferase